MSGCHHFVPLLEPLQDGELQAAQVAEVEQHLDECGLCAERVRLAEAMRASLKQIVRADAPVSAAFEERIRLALSAELERQERQSPEHDAQVRMLSWRSILPIAAAAAVVMVWAASANNRTNDVMNSQAGMYQSVSPASVEKLLEDLVKYHEHAAAPEFTEPELLPQLATEVGVPLKVPSFKQFGGHWEGISVVPVSNQRAASLRYRLAGHRLTVYVYDASRMPMRAPLQVRLVRNEPVYVGERHGVSIATRERRDGIGYAVATDLNRDESAELVASIY